MKAVNLRMMTAAGTELCQKEEMPNVQVEINEFSSINFVVVMNEQVLSFIKISLRTFCPIEH